MIEKMNARAQTQLDACKIRVQIYRNKNQSAHRMNEMGIYQVNKTAERN